MAFRFDFASNDLDDERDTVHESNSHADHGAPQFSEAVSKSIVAVEEHDIDAWLSSLPDRLSYSLIPITSPNGTTFHIPRRELFDVRQQIMAEDDAEAESTLQNLSKTDLRTDVYEGGFKTWECSLDLAKLMIDRDTGAIDTSIELGAGSAVPSLVLLAKLLEPAAITTLLALPARQERTTLILADYNRAVLRLVTLPNLLLTYAVPRQQLSNDHAEAASGDLEVTPELIADFRTSLDSAKIDISLLSGPWSSDLLGMLKQHITHEHNVLILAAETIYSPASTEAFVDLVTQLLARNTHPSSSRAIVAAKRMYFGIGGSIDGLCRSCKARGAATHDLLDTGITGMVQGIGRALVEITMP